MGDRYTLLPRELITPIRRHLENARKGHTSDVDRGYGCVALPHALERRYSEALRIPATSSDSEGGMSGMRICDTLFFSSFIRDEYFLYPGQPAASGDGDNGACAWPGASGIAVVVRTGVWVVWAALCAGPLHAA